MRDLYDDPHPEFTARMMADLTAKAPAEALDGDFAGKPSQVHAGSNARQWVSERAAVEKLRSLGFEWHLGEWRASSLQMITVDASRLTPDCLADIRRTFAAPARLVPVTVKEP